MSGQADTMKMVRLLEHALFPECASAVPYLPRVDIGEPVDSEPDADVEYEELLPRHGTYDCYRASVLPWNVSALCRFMCTSGDKAFDSRGFL